jgi:hypothetical protein
VLFKNKERARPEWIEHYLHRGAEHFYSSTTTAPIGAETFYSLTWSAAWEDTRLLEQNLLIKPPARHPTMRV